MSEKAKEPVIRFKGFSGEWEEKKLGEIALFNPKEELPQEFEYVDLESVVGTEMLSHRTETKITAPSRAQRLARTGDLFYQTVRPYQRNNYLYEKTDNNYVFSTGYAQMRPFVDGYFLLSLVQSERFVNVVLDNCTGTSYPAINTNDLAEIVVVVPPNKEEQQKIGSYFRQLDRLITLYQRKYNKLTSVKKSMLQKMFPQNAQTRPALRFAGFTDKWQVRKLGEVATYRRGSFPQPYGKSEWYDGEDAKPFVQIADVTDAMNLVEDTKQKISKLAQPMSVFAEKNSVLVTLQGSIGRVAITQYGAFVDRTVLIFEKYKTKIDTLFWAYSIKQKFVEEARKAPGGIIKTITKEALSDFDLLLPNYEEQQKIGSYFRQLDHLIALCQQELQKLQNLKKACLKKMFV